MPTRYAFTENALIGLLRSNGTGAGCCFFPVGEDVDLSVSGSAADQKLKGASTSPPSSLQHRHLRDGPSHKNVKDEYWEHVLSAEQPATLALCELLYHPSFFFAETPLTLRIRVYPAAPVKQTVSLVRPCWYVLEKKDGFTASQFPERCRVGLSVLHHDLYDHNPRTTMAVGGEGATPAPPLQNRSANVTDQGEESSFCMVGGSGHPSMGMRDVVIRDWEMQLERVPVCCSATGQINQAVVPPTTTAAAMDETSFFFTSSLSSSSPPPRPEAVSSQSHRSSQPHSSLSRDAEREAAIHKSKMSWSPLPRNPANTDGRAGAGHSGFNGVMHVGGIAFAPPYEDSVPSVAASASTSATPGSNEMGSATQASHRTTPPKLMTAVRLAGEEKTPHSDHEGHPPPHEDKRQAGKERVGVHPDQKGEGITPDTVFCDHNNNNNNTDVCAELELPLRTLYHIATILAEAPSASSPSVSPERTTTRGVKTSSSTDSMTMKTGSSPSPAPTPGGLGSRKSDSGRDTHQENSSNGPRLSFAVESAAEETSSVIVENHGCPASSVSGAGGGSELEESQWKKRAQMIKAEDRLRLFLSLRWTGCTAGGGGYGEVENSSVVEKVLQDSPRHAIRRVTLDIVFPDSVEGHQLHQQWETLRAAAYPLSPLFRLDGGRLEGRHITPDSSSVNRSKSMIRGPRSSSSPPPSSSRESSSTHPNALTTLESVSAKRTSVSNSAILTCDPSPTTITQQAETSRRGDNDFVASGAASENHRWSTRKQENTQRQKQKQPYSRLKNESQRVINRERDDSKEEGTEIVIDVDRTEDKHCSRNKERLETSTLSTATTSATMTTSATVVSSLSDERDDSTLSSTQPAQGTARPGPRARERRTDGSYDDDHESENECEEEEEEGEEGDSELVLVMVQEERTTTTSLSGDNSNAANTSSPYSSSPSSRHADHHPYNVDGAIGANDRSEEGTEEEEGTEDVIVVNVEDISDSLDSIPGTTEGEREASSHPYNTLHPAAPPLHHSEKQISESRLSASAHDGCSTHGSRSSPALSPFSSYTAGEVSNVLEEVVVEIDEEDDNHDDDDHVEDTDEKDMTQEKLQATPSSIWSSTSPSMVALSTPSQPAEEEEGGQTSVSGGQGRPRSDSSHHHHDHHRDANDVEPSMARESGSAGHRPLLSTATTLEHHEGGPWKLEPSPLLPQNDNGDRRSESGRSSGLTRSTGRTTTGTLLTDSGRPSAHVSETWRDVEEKGAVRVVANEAVRKTEGGAPRARAASVGWSSAASSTRTTVSNSPPCMEIPPPAPGPNTTNMTTTTTTTTVEETASAASPPLPLSRSSPTPHGNNNHHSSSGILLPHGHSSSRTSSLSLSSSSSHDTAQSSAAADRPHRDASINTDLVIPPYADVVVTPSRSSSSPPAVAPSATSSAGPQAVTSASRSSSSSPAAWMPTLPPKPSPPSVRGESQLKHDSSCTAACVTDDAPLMADSRTSTHKRADTTPTTTAVYLDGSATTTSADIERSSTRERLTFQKQPQTQRDTPFIQLYHYEDSIQSDVVSLVPHQICSQDHCRGASHTLPPHHEEEEEEEEAGLESPPPGEVLQQNSKNTDSESFWFCRTSSSIDPRMRDPQTPAETPAAAAAAGASSARGSANRSAFSTCRDGRSASTPALGTQRSEREWGVPDGHVSGRDRCPSPPHDEYWIHSRSASARRTAISEEGRSGSITERWQALLQRMDQRRMEPPGKWTSTTVRPPPPRKTPVLLRPGDGGHGSHGRGHHSNPLPRASTITTPHRVEIMPSMVYPRARPALEGDTSPHHPHDDNVHPGEDSARRSGSHTAYHYDDRKEREGDAWGGFSSPFHHSTLAQTLPRQSKNPNNDGRRRAGKNPAARAPSALELLQRSWRQRSSSAPPAPEDGGTKERREKRKGLIQPVERRTVRKTMDRAAPAMRVPTSSSSSSSFTTTTSSSSLDPCQHEAMEQAGGTVLPLRGRPHRQLHHGRERDDGLHSNGKRTHQHQHQYDDDQHQHHRHRSPERRHYYMSSSATDSDEEMEEEEERESKGEGEAFLYVPHDGPPCSTLYFPSSSSATTGPRPLLFRGAVDSSSSHSRRGHVAAALEEEAVASREPSQELSSIATKKTRKMNAEREGAVRRKGTAAEDTAKEQQQQQRPQLHRGAYKEMLLRLRRAQEEYAYKHRFDPIFLRGQLLGDNSATYDDDDDEWNDNDTEDDEEQSEQRLRRDDERARVSRGAKHHPVPCTVARTTISHTQQKRGQRQLSPEAPTSPPLSPSPPQPSRNNSARASGLAQDHPDIVSARLLRSSSRSSSRTSSSSHTSPPPSVPVRDAVRLAMQDKKSAARDSVDTRSSTKTYHSEPQSSRHHHRRAASSHLLRTDEGPLPQRRQNQSPHDHRNDKNKSKKCEEAKPTVEPIPASTTALPSMSSFASPLSLSGGMVQCHTFLIWKHHASRSAVGQRILIVRRAEEAVTVRRHHGVTTTVFSSASASAPASAAHGASQAFLAVQLSLSLLKVEDNTPCDVSTETTSSRSPNGEVFSPTSARSDSRSRRSRRTTAFSHHNAARRLEDVLPPLPLIPSSGDGGIMTTSGRLLSSPLELELGAPSPTSENRPPVVSITKQNADGVSRITFSMLSPVPPPLPPPPPSPASRDYHSHQPTTATTTKTTTTAAFMRDERRIPGLELLVGQQAIAHASGVLREKKLRDAANGFVALYQGEVIMAGELPNAEAVHILREVVLHASGKED